MKKLKTTIPDGGAPLGQFPVLRDIFDIETKDAIEAMLSTVIIGETEGIQSLLIVPQIRMFLYVLLHLKAHHKQLLRKSLIIAIRLLY